MTDTSAYKDSVDTMTQVASGLWVPKHSAEEVKEKASRTRGANYGLFRRSTSRLIPRNRRNKEGILSYVFEMLFEAVFFNVAGVAGGWVMEKLRRLFDRSKESDQDAGDAGKEANDVGDTAEDIDTDAAKEILRVTKETNDIVKKLAEQLATTDRDEDPDGYDACVKAGGAIVDATGDCVIKLCTARDEAVEQCLDTFIKSNEGRAGVSGGDTTTCAAPNVVEHETGKSASCDPTPAPTCPPSPAGSTPPAAPPAPPAPPAPAATPTTPAGTTPQPPAPTPAPPTQPASTTPPPVETIPATPATPEVTPPPKGTKTNTNSVTVNVNCECDGDEAKNHQQTRRVVPADATEDQSHTQDAHTDEGLGERHEHHSRTHTSTPVNTEPNEEDPQPESEWPDTENPQLEEHAPQPDGDSAAVAGGILAGLLGLGAGILIAEFLHNNLGDLLAGLTGESPDAPLAPPAAPPVEPAAATTPAPEPKPAPAQPAPAPAPTPTPVCTTPPPTPAPAPAPAGPAVATGAPTTPGVASSTPPPLRHAGGARKAGGW